MTTADHVSGLPGWIQVAADDIAAAADFYCGLFGWEAVGAENEPVSEMSYVVFAKHGAMVAGMMPKADPGETMQWLVFFQVVDIRSAVGAVEAFGGRVLVRPTVIPGAVDGSRFSICADVTGTLFGIMQTTSLMFGRAHEPGFPTWLELAAPGRLEELAEFYRAVFGWEIAQAPGVEMTYLGWSVTPGGPPAGGMWDATAMLDEGELGLWWLSFHVEDVDAAADLVFELGGDVEWEPSDTQFGRVAVVRDPQGARFSLLGPAGK